MTTFTTLDGYDNHYRTWQFQINTAVTAQATVSLTNGRGLRLAKDAMTGTGSWVDAANVTITSTGNWTVVSSCNGPTGTSGGSANQFGNNDNVDRWVNDVDVGWGTVGANHSWIVLKQTGIIGGDYYLCIDCVGTDTSRLSYAWSKNQFTGGTATARPTSLNEMAQDNTTYPLASARNWGGPTANASSVMHVLKSADGKATRIMWARNGFSSGLWCFEELEYAPAAYTNPAIAIMHGTNATAPVSSALVQSNFANFGNFSPLVQLNGTYPAYAVLALNYYSTNQSLVTVPTVANDMSTFWPAYRVKVHTKYNSGLIIPSNLTPINRARGEHGIMRDIWWVQSQLGEADYAPSGGGRNFIIVGDFLLPWNTIAATMT